MHVEIWGWSLRWLARRLSLCNKHASGWSSNRNPEETSLTNFGFWFEYPKGIEKPLVQVRHRSWCGWRRGKESPTSSTLAVDFCTTARFSHPSLHAITCQVAPSTSPWRSMEGEAASLQHLSCRSSPPRQQLRLSPASRLTPPLWPPTLLSST